MSEKNINSLKSRIAVTKKGYNFKFWNIDEVNDDCTVGLFGPRGCGKTTVTVNLLKQKKLFRGIAMCPTPECFATYGEFIPKSYVYDYFSEDVLIRIMNYQKSQSFAIHTNWRKEVADMMVQHEERIAADWNLRLQKIEERALANNFTRSQIESAFVVEKEEYEFQNKQAMASIRSWARQRKKELRRPFSMFIILDDLASNKKDINSETVKYLMNNGRHYFIFLVIAIQYCIDFPAACRGGLDWVVIFYDSLAPNLKRLYQNYVGCFPNQDMFEAVLKTAAGNGQAIVIRKNNPSPKLEDSVFLFQPDHLFLNDLYFGDANFEYVHHMFYNQRKFDKELKGKRSGNGIVSNVKEKKGKRNRNSEEAAPDDETDLKNQLEKEEKKNHFKNALKVLREKLKEKNSASNA